MDTNTALPATIRAWMEARRMNILMLSRHTNIPYTTLHRKLTDSPGKINMTELGKIADILGVDPVALISGDLPVQEVKAA